MHGIGPRWWVGVGDGWVEYDRPVAFRGRGLAHCWVLRRHPWRVCSWAAVAADRLTPACVGGGGWCGDVWLFVECYIVDASILLW